MNIARWMPSRRPARGACLWLALALVLGAADAGRSQAKQSASENPVQTIFAKLKALLSDPKLKDKGVDADGILVALYNKHLTYVPSSYPVKAGGAVTWTSFDGPFTITPLGASPFDHAPIESVASDTPFGTVYVAKATVPANTPKGTYHYVLSLYFDKVYTDVNCPPIIVE